MPLSTRRLCVFKNVSMIFLVSALLKYPSRPSPSSLSSLRSTKSLKLKNKRCFFLRMSHRAHSRSFLVDQPCAPSGQIRQPQRLATISEHLRQTCTALLFHNRPIHDDNVPLSILIVDSMHPLKMPAFGGDAAPPKIQVNQNMNIDILHPESATKSIKTAFRLELQDCAVELMIPVTWIISETLWPRKADVLCTELVEPILVQQDIDRTSASPC